MGSPGSRGGVSFYGNAAGGIVRDSIISNDAVLSDIMLEQSIIGENAEVHGTYAKINLGDASNVKLAH